MEYDKWKELNLKTGPPLLFGVGILFRELRQMDIYMGSILAGILIYVVFDILLFLQIRGYL